MLDEAVDWLMRLGDDYGVDPLLYGLIWIGSLPFFLLSLGWLVQRLRRREELLLPLLVTAFFFLAPTLYVFAAGRNLPPWVYAVLVGLAVIGAVSTARRVRRRLRA
jgi:peptidoglycan/LPS O-acetylase OafA/YrhL